MKEVKFKTLTGKNFLSIGNVPIVFSFPEGINIITGYNFDKNDENGVGKCLDKTTEIEIRIEDKTVLECFKKSLNKM